MMGKWSGWIAMLTLTVWMGCVSNSPSPAYYNLNSRSDPSHPVSRNALTVGVGPVRLPDYLDHSAIVTRLSPNRLQINHSHRWAGSLQQEIIRVLAANIKSETTVGQVVVYPWRSDAEPDVYFRITFHAFEGRPAGRIQLKATWSLHRNASGQATLIRDSEVIETVSNNSFEALTQGMGRALAVLSHEMAAVLSAEGLAVHEPDREN